MKAVNVKIHTSWCLSWTEEWARDQNGFKNVHVCPHTGCFNMSTILRAAGPGPLSNVPWEHIMAFILIHHLLGPTGTDFNIRSLLKKPKHKKTISDALRSDPSSVYWKQPVSNQRELRNHLISAVTAEGHLAAFALSVFCVSDLQLLYSWWHLWNAPLNIITVVLFSSVKHLW